MKGFDWDGDTELKIKYSEEQVENYYIFYSVKELKNFLDTKT